MTMKTIASLALLAGMATIGCAKTLYHWGGYDEALYDHYKNPQNRDEYVAKLSGVITEAEKSGGVVPPGCYAEYGWALYEQGHAAEAVTYFEKEAKQWPDSRPLMEKLIRNVSRQASAKAAAPPSTATTAVPASTTTTQESGK
jgi:hypothetical protein